MSTSLKSKRGAERVAFTAARLDAKHGADVEYDAVVNDRDLGEMRLSGLSSRAVAWFVLDTDTLSMNYWSTGPRED